MKKVIEVARGPADRKCRYTEAQKIEALQTYLVMGSMEKTGVLLKIPNQTLWEWRNKPWWNEMVAEIRLQDNLQLSNKLKRMVEKGVDVVQDRLEKGDWIYDQKTGQMRRKPVSLRDTHKVIMDSVGLQQKLLGTEILQQSKETIEDRLTQIATKFEQFVNKQKTPETIEVTDVIFVNSETPTEPKQENEETGGNPVPIQEK